MPPKKKPAAKTLPITDDADAENTGPMPAVRKAKQISMLEHAKKKSMWAGSKNTQTIESYVLTNDTTAPDDSKIFAISELKYPPALLKIIDEVVVNAIDHHTHYPKLVTEISINVSTSGQITVRNNGPGIPVEETENINGKKMYLPQLIASEFLAGDNLDDAGTNVKGGTNGIGLKLAAAFSTELILTTADKNTNLLYTQKFLSGLTVIEPPVITPMAKSAKPYTEISFMPDYAEFKLDPFKFNKTLTLLMETRAWQAAAYTKAKVAFNGNAIPIKSFEDFCQMFSENEVYCTGMENDKSKKHPWEVCFTVSDGKERHISIVNGVYMPKGGSHIQYIQNQIVDNLRANVEKEIKKSGVKFNKNYILNNVFIFMKGEIPSPEFLSQTKEAISDPIEKFNGYVISDSSWKKIWALIEPAVMATFLKKQLGELKTRANRGKVDVPKYKEARFCRNAKKAHECSLIVTEGDSATATANKGLLAKASPGFNYEYFGTYGIQGVMMNGLKESIELKKKKRDKKATVDDETEEKKMPKKRGAKTTEDIPAAKKPAAKKKHTVDDLAVMGKRLPNKKLMSNERIASLIKVLGLDFNKTYDLTPIGEKEFKTLRYGAVIGLTDQDLDGFNIFGLLASFFTTYWPSLIKRGFLRRINTPVIRAYPKNKKEFVKEFYSEKDARAWYEEVGEEKVKSRYTINYYKGLGSHDQAYKEVTQMFKNIDAKICTYEFDADALKSMFVYYGPDTAPRKAALARPATREPVDTLSIPLSQHFDLDSNAYQRDNIIRKLLNAVDGFVASRRKVFFTARKNGHKKIKVQGLAGLAVSEANYHHGEASLEQTIVRMAQKEPMARNLPLLQPMGEYGSRSKGYKDYAASRYIHTMINWRLADKLFRREDEFILKYTVDDGHRYEPEFYVPIIPYVLCETNELPATGWAISVHARDIKAIFKNVRAMINGKITKCGKLPMWNHRFKGTVKKYKNRNYHVGVYEYNDVENYVHITELPPGTFSDAYLKGSNNDKIKKKDEEKKGIQSKEWVADFEDDTTEENVDIRLYLRPGAYDALTADDSGYGNEVFDCFEEYFELKEPIYDRINLINDKGEVVEYKSYEAVFDDWFQFRKDLYAVRIEREIILTDLELKMLRNVQRFNREHDKYKITNKTAEEEAIEILSVNKYDIFNQTILENPRFTSVKELIALITKAELGASYEYLLKISYRELTEGAYAKREKRIKELEDRMNILADDSGAFIGAKMWLSELDELEKVIEIGIETAWLFGDADYKFEE
jgi:DNA topoisomerase-2